MTSVFGGLRTQTLK